MIGKKVFTPDVFNINYNGPCFLRERVERHVWEIEGRDCLKCIGRCQSVRNSLMQVAVRKPSKETSIALLRNEFFAVSARKWREKAAESEVDIYQALEFRKGCDMPLECRADCPRKRVRTYGSMACTMPPRPSLGGPM